MPLSNAHHGGGAEPPELGARIDAELRTRIEDAVDFACLDAMVRAREARGEAAPVADNPRDRAEYDARVKTFLARLATELLPQLADDERHRLEAASPRRYDDDVAAAIGVQITLARALPDYWQRFETVRADFAATAGASGRQGRGVLDWLLGRD